MTASIQKRRPHGDALSGEKELLEENLDVKFLGVFASKGEGHC